MEYDYFLESNKERAMLLIKIQSFKCTEHNFFTNTVQRNETYLGTSLRVFHVWTASINKITRISWKTKVLWFLGRQFQFILHCQWLRLLICLRKRLSKVYFLEIRLIPPNAVVVLQLFLSILHVSRCRLGRFRRVINSIFTSEAIV